MVDHPWMQRDIIVTLLDVMDVGSLYNCFLLCKKWNGIMITHRDKYIATVPMLAYRWKRCPSISAGILRATAALFDIDVGAGLVNMAMRGIG